MKGLSDLRSAILFITILPAGRDVPWSPLGMIRFFPVVGIILGILLFGFDRLASLFWAPGVVSILDTVWLVLLTGAFHLDGLGDSADGLFSHRPKERVLEIMKDSRTGMMGLVAVVCMLAVKSAGIYAMKTQLHGWAFAAACIIIPAYARASMLFGIRFLRYGRKNTGTGLDLFEKPLAGKEFVYLLIPVLLSLTLGVKCLLINLVFTMATAGLLYFYKLKLNCITGDMLGAMTETIETILFLAAGTAVF